MKKIIIILLLALGIGTRTEAQNNFQMTVKTGTQANSVQVFLRPLSTVMGQFSSLQITLLIPSTITPRPNAAIFNNPFGGGGQMAYLLYTSTETVSDGTYHVYTFDGVAGASQPTQTYTGTTEYLVLEIVFSGAPGQNAQARVAQVPNGGTGGTAPGQYNFFVALNGSDVTNQPAQFYGGISSNDGSGYAGYSFAGVNGVNLPVNWKNISILKKNDDAVLDWVVTNEDNNDRFDIERSLDSRTFAKIGTIKSAGAYYVENKYQYVDKNISSLKSPIVYYRIRQFDIDGKTTISRILSLRLSGKEMQAEIKPNPTVNSTVLFFESMQDQKVNLRIVDSKGRTVRNQKTQMFRGLNQFSIQVNELAVGTYQLVLTADGTDQIFTLVKQ